MLQWLICEIVAERGLMDTAKPTTEDGFGHRGEEAMPPQIRMTTALVDEVTFLLTEYFVLDILTD
jgi:hypothetical protein